MEHALAVLGTASRAPTRERNHNGYVLAWGDVQVLFDPGEGTQRQLLHAGIRSSSITHIAITHEHGDHCMGLPGVLQRMMVDQRVDPITLLYPDQAEAHVDRLVGIGLYDQPVDLRRLPVPTDRTSTMALTDRVTLTTSPLNHRVPTVGYRVELPESRKLDGAALADLGLDGPVVGRLVEAGSIVHDGTVVDLDQVSSVRPARAAAVIMDTRRCDAIVELSRGADLALLEATYQDGDEALAMTYGHLTARQAGEAAATAGVRRLVLSHYSARYRGIAEFARQAGDAHGDVVAAVDLQVVDAP